MSVDLNELDRLRAAATPGTWHRYQTGIGEFVCATAQGKGNAVYADTPGGTYPSADLHLIVALINAYPALAAELRALRKVRDEVQQRNLRYGCGCAMWLPFPERCPHVEEP